MKPDVSPPERSNDPAPDDTAAHPALTRSLWEQFISRGNLAEALRRVEQNAGAPGIDGMSTKELRPWLHSHWPQVRSQLEAGTYRPQPVRRVMIPKPSGGQRSPLLRPAQRLLDQPRPARIRRTLPPLPGMLSEPPDADPHVRWCGGRPCEPGAYPICPLRD